MTRVDQLRELVHQHGYREATVTHWTEERIATVLASRRREKRNDVHRARHTAERIDGKKGSISKLERIVAAAHLEQATEQGGDELIQAVLYVGWCLHDAELRTLATDLIAKLRGEDEQPAQHEVGTAAPGWFDANSVGDD